MTNDCESTARPFAKMSQWRGPVVMLKAEGYTSILQPNVV